VSLIHDLVWLISPLMESKAARGVRRRASFAIGLVFSLLASAAAGPDRPAPAPAVPADGNPAARQREAFLIHIPCRLPAASTRGSAMPRSVCAERVQRGGRAAGTGLRVLGPARANLAGGAILGGRWPWLGFFPAASSPECRRSPTSLKPSRATRPCGHGL